MSGTSLWESYVENRRANEALIEAADTAIRLGLEGCLAEIARLGRPLSTAAIEGIAFVTARQLVASIDAHVPLDGGQVLALASRLLSGALILSRGQATSLPPAKARPRLWPWRRR